MRRAIREFARRFFGVRYEDGLRLGWRQKPAGWLWCFWVGPFGILWRR
jgi:hypothetical protein